MVQTKVRTDWEHTSALAAVILNQGRMGNFVPLDFMVPRFDSGYVRAAVEVITDAETKRQMAVILAERFKGR